MIICEDELPFDEKTENFKILFICKFAFPDVVDIDVDANERFETKIG